MLLGEVFKRRFERTRSFDDLNQGIQIFSTVVETAPLDHPDRIHFLNRAGIVLCLRFKEYGLMEDLDRAIEIGIDETENNMEALKQDSLDNKNDKIYNPKTTQPEPPTDSGYASATNIKFESAQNAESLEWDDVKTIYSDAPSLPASRKENYLSELADDLFKKACPEKCGGHTIERISGILFELLKAFALKVGHNAPTQMHRDVMVFIHKYRSDIVGYFKGRYSDEVESIADVQTGDSNKMSLEELMGLWDKNRVDYENGAPHDQNFNDGTDEGGDIEINNSEHLAYRDFIFRAPAHEWLLANLRREFYLAPAEPNSMDAIRQNIVDSLPLSHKDPLSSVKEQEYTEEPAEAVKIAITLTGSAKNAQALTCTQYLSQTWPSAGEHTIRLVADVVRSGPDYQRTWDSVAEIGEQFAWPGAALRSSPYESGVAYCTPFIRDIHGDNAPHPASERQDWLNIFCKIDFTVQQRGECLKHSNDQYWYNMFRNPIVVQGYPILHRPKSNTGLEISLNMKAGLIRTRVPHAEDTSVFDLEKARQVVGWCSEIKYYAGAADARYTINTSKPLKPYKECVLEKISISGGKIITGGVTIGLGKKDTPIHVTRNGYIPNLKWISKNALLHLVRASLEYNSRDKFKSVFCFRREEIQEASQRHKVDSAFDVLLNLENMELKIYPEKDDYIRFKHQVEYYCNTLEKLIDHQVVVAGQDGVNLKFKARKYLEGWDFKDIATDQDPFYPRVATLETIGKGWVDFTRAIHAITLFGRGFGEIIQPVDTINLCTHWAKLPQGKYYLATCVSDLKDIMNMGGDQEANPMKLDTGNPQQGEPSSPSKGSETQFHDSRIGSNLSSSASEGNEDSAYSGSQQPLGEISSNESLPTPVLEAAGSDGNELQISFTEEHDNFGSADTRLDHRPKRRGSFLQDMFGNHRISGRINKLRVSG
ncbi:MAG: hypothetical protein M1834_008387 [Cirrosporium novae-zelandiae]|nr:MAG: hypothetical protein M1834_008387 [Cirrosporium novae-zelandiae]